MPRPTSEYVRLLLCFLLLVGFSTILEAQNRVYEEDVVYLKNGSVLRGEIIEHEIGDYVKIRLREGAIFSYKTTEIEKITREASKFTKLKLKYYAGFLPVRYREKGDIFTQISYALTFNETEAQTLTNFSTHIRTLYHMNTYLNIGLGTGFDFYEGGLIIPVFAELQGDFLKSRITPVYILQGGYGIGAGGTGDHIIFRGGMMAHAALGAHWYTGSKRSYMITLGFKFQNTYQEFWQRSPVDFCCIFPPPPTPDPALVIGDRRYQKIVLQFTYNF